LTEKVAIVKVNENLSDALRTAIDLVGDIDFQDGEKVVIKPNLSDLRSSEDGVTTSVEFTEEIVQWIKEKANAKITIAESNHWVATADEEFEKLGYYNLRDKYRIRLANISHERKIKIALDGFHIKSLQVPTTLFECNKLVSVAKLKTHAAYKITCILKNQFGLITKREKSGYHAYMSETLADLYRFYKPDLCVVDGIIALQGAGPTFGEPIKTGVIICGKDAVAVDLVAAKLMGFEANDVPYLKFAIKNGVSAVRGLRDIEIVGERLATVERRFKFIPRLSYSLIRFGYAATRFGKSFSETLDGIVGIIPKINVLVTQDVRRTAPLAYKVIRNKIAGLITTMRYSRYK
jgi:uncharacterized protein (DUF362 family)